MNETNRIRLRHLTTVAMLSAVASVLMFLEFSIPLVPSFIKLEFSDLPALLASFALGPVSGVVVCLVKNLIHLFVTYTAGVGELCNFLIGCLLVLPAGWIYKVHRNRKSALLGSAIGAVSMAVLSVPVNYYIAYPAYTLLMSMEVILGMYQKLNPHVENLWQALFWFNMPFTFCKALVIVGVTFLIYKRIAPILKGKSA